MGKLPISLDIGRSSDGPIGQFVKSAGVLGSPRAPHFPSCSINHTEPRYSLKRRLPRWLGSR